MSSLPPVDTRSRPRLALIGLALVLTFLAGLALAAYLGRRYALFAPQGSPVAAVPARAAASPAPLPAAAPAPDFTVLAAREEELSARIAALEARLSTVGVDAEAAGARAGRAEALLAAAAARRALDRGQPLGWLEEQLRRRFPADVVAVDTVIRAARAPVTLEDLRLGFDAVAPELQTGAAAGFFPALRRELGALVVLRRTNSPSALPAERVARARRLLDSGQVEAALAEARTLPGAGRAAGWTAAAARYADARRALDRLEGAAVAGPETPLPAAPAPVTAGSARS